MYLSVLNRGVLYIERELHGKPSWFAINLKIRTLYGGVLYMGCTLYGGFTVLHRKEILNFFGEPFFIRVNKSCLKINLELKDFQISYKISDRDTEIFVNTKIFRVRIYVE